MAADALWTGIGFLALVVGWKAASLGLPPVVLPSPEGVLKSLTLLLKSGGFFHNLLVFLRRVLVGVLLSLATGGAWGTLCVSPHLGGLFRALLSAALAVPVIGVVVLVLIWFSGDAIPVAVSVIVVAPVVATNVAEGLLHAKQKFEPLKKVFNIRGADYTLKVLLPATWPSVLSSLRISLGQCPKTVLIGEFFGLSDGLGVYLSEAKLWVDTPRVFAILLILIGISLVGSSAVASVEGRIKALEKVAPSGRFPAGKMFPVDSLLWRGRGGKLLHASEIKKSFGKTRVLDGVNVELGGGEVLGILGPNGSGKTTLVNILAGILPPDGGTIEMPKGATVSMVFQDRKVLPWLSPLENVRLACKSTERALKFLSMIGLSRWERVPCYKLSGGMVTRVAVARALSVKPDILILDEPFGDLDKAARSWLEETILKLKSKGVGIILVTHEENLMKRLCDRTLLLGEGKA